MNDHYPTPSTNTGYSGHLGTERPPETNLSWVGCLVSVAALAMTTGGIIFGLVRLAKRRRR